MNPVVLDSDYGDRFQLSPAVMKKEKKKEKLQK